MEEPVDSLMLAKGCHDIPEDVCHYCGSAECKGCGPDESRVCVCGHQLSNHWTGHPLAWTHCGISDCQCAMFTDKAVTCSHGQPIGDCGTCHLELALTMHAQELDDLSLEAGRVLTAMEAHLYRLRRLKERLVGEALEAQAKGIHFDDKGNRI